MGDVRKGRLVVYPEDPAGSLWTWKLTASNGVIYMHGPKSFSSKRNALLAAARTLRTIQQVQFTPVDQTGAVITTV